MRVLFFLNQYNTFNYDTWPYFQKTFYYTKLYNTFSVWFNRFYSVVILGIIPLLLQVNDTVEQRTEKRTPFAFGHCLQTWLAVCLNGQVRFQHSAPPLWRLKNRKKRNTALKILSNPITLKIFSIQFGCALFRAAFHYTLLRTNNPIKLKLDEKTNYTRLSLFNCLSFYHTKKRLSTVLCQKHEQMF